MKWKAADIPDLSGKIAIITGGNSGLGYQACLALARKGATVILTARIREKGQAAADRILEEVPGADVTVMKIDLSNIESIKHFADSFIEEFEKLDILINNAGVMAIPLVRTVQGFEMQFGTNHLGHFVLTSLLIDILNNTENSRIVNVSSLAYRIGRMDFENLNGEKAYSKWRAYGLSKLANLLFTIELDRRLRMAGKGTFVASAHPGYARTNLQLNGPEMAKSKIGKSFVKLANSLFAQPARMGVLPILYAATAPEAESAKFYGPDKLFGFYGYPREEIMDPDYVNPYEAPKLWEISEKLTGVRFIIK